VRFARRSGSGHCRPRLKTNAALVIPLRTGGRTCLAPSKRPWRTCPSTATGSRGFARPACSKNTAVTIACSPACFSVRPCSSCASFPSPRFHWLELATRTTGDSHALDAGKPLSALCLQAIAQQQGLKLSRSADCRRQLWDSVGVVVDELSAPVLVLNLRGAASTLVGQLLNLMADSANHVILPFASFAGRTKRSSENGTSARSRFARIPASSQPRPSVSVRAACRSSAPRGNPRPRRSFCSTFCAEAGCRLRYHGDLDPPGSLSLIC